MNCKIGDKVMIKRGLEDYKYYPDRKDPKYSFPLIGSLSRYGGQVFVVKKIKRKYYPYPERIVIDHPIYRGCEIELSKEMFVPVNESSILFHLEKRRAA